MAKNKSSKEDEKLRDFANTEISSIQGEYTLKDLKSEIEELDNAVQKYKSLEEGTKDYIKKNRVLKGHSDELKDGLLSPTFACNWSKCKSDIYDYWKHKDSDIIVRNPRLDSTTTLMTYCMLITAGVLNLFLIDSDISFMTRLIRTICYIFFTGELTSAILSVYTYIIKPNSMYRKKVKKDLVGLQNKIKGLEAQLTYKRELLEAKKAADLKPKDVIDKVKRRTNGTMQEEVDNAREEILPNIAEAYREKFELILNKSSELLKVCSVDTDALNEVSSIYNICIAEVSGILIRNGEKQSMELEQLLSNFEEYLDRKIKKYEAIREMSLKTDVNALNSIFESDK